jgi:hypothetical protein
MTITGSKKTYDELPLDHMKKENLKETLKKG